LPLAVRQAARLEELAEPGGGLPWRHHAALDGIANVVPLVVRITIGDQRERRVLPGAVTGLAARLENRDDLVVERRGPLLRWRRRREQEHHGQSHEKKPPPHRKTSATDQMP